MSLPDDEASVAVLIDEQLAGWRLDQALQAAGVHESRSRVKAIIESGAVTLLNGPDEATVADPAGAPVMSASRRVRLGEHYLVVVPQPETAAPIPEPMTLAIVFEDADLVVIDKPAGLVVHPGAGNPRGTLVNGLLAHCGESLSGIGGVRRPGIVHRLDKDTSGLIVVAKSDRAHRGLAAQFASHGRDGRLERRYDAIVWGWPPAASGVVDAAIARAPDNRLRMAITRSGGRHAVTRWRRIERFGAPAGGPLACHIACMLETGRTHQIRVHMTSIGHPLLGDETYGKGYRASVSRLGASAREALQSLARQALHAGVLGFEHPVSGKPMRFERAMPEDMAALISALRREGESAAG
ncbi:MAG: RluA family pseudouridine synthase [Rhizobiales bacterium]|nr:RluA family pseudouridine synthase [Hyphomicrobiales bacterium]